MSNISVRKEFHDFGKYIQVAAILTIVSITTGMAGLIAMIFVFIAIGTLKRANKILNNSSLREFRSKYIKGVISRICGMVVLIIGGVNIGLFYFFPSPFPFYISLSIPIILMIVGIVLIYVGVAAEMKAWKNLKAFFENNYKMFPANISEEAIEGCDRLKTGALLSSLWFLIVPAIIGFIYQVKGYFNLATFNKLSTYDAPEPIELQVDLPTPEPIKDPDRKINFCPNCGAKLSEIGNFCALCGSEIR
ncbi:MAG: zinc ribbon domain-containing protein [Candidatus Hermodarchaeota archaeon]